MCGNCRHAAFIGGRSAHGGSFDEGSLVESNSFLGALREYYARRASDSSSSAGEAADKDKDDKLSLLAVERNWVLIIPQEVALPALKKKRDGPRFDAELLQDHILRRFSGVDTTSDGGVLYVTLLGKPVVLRGGHEPTVTALKREAILHDIRGSEDTFNSGFEEERTVRVLFESRVH